MGENSRGCYCRPGQPSTEIDSALRNCIDGRIVRGMATRDHVSSALRCFELLEVLAQPPYEHGVKEVAEATGLAMASAHRGLATLVEAGFAEQDASTRRYRVAGKALWTGAAFLRRSAVYHAAFFVIQDLARDVDGLVHLGVLDSGTVLYLHTVGKVRSASLCADTGDRRPVHSTALGKAMLAYQPLDAVERAMVNAPRFTPRTITALDDMQRELALVRTAGVAIDEEEGAAGLRCAAAPIFGPGGHLEGAMSIATNGLPIETVRGPYAMLVREATLRISVQLGYRAARPVMA
jgi:IclR family transcriptional regulator, acetate operon repressor